ncbi:MAG: TonB-dependent receptor [Pseudomonadota bacterium]
MKSNLTPIASAVALLVMSTAMSAHAQQAESKAEPKANTQEVVVTGIRASLQQSLTQKRNADSLVEVVTAEDIGKMPDKNIADAVQRLPGVTISSAGGGEGGFDENDRVSMRGTNPSLTQTTINGHAVASGDWFVLNQVGNVGRSVSYTLLPSELVGSVVVHKSSQADLVEGGVTGSVDIITRRPLEFKKQVTVEAAIGTVYADLPKTSDPQFNGLFNWKNDANTLGFMVQAFSEKRHLRRDGQETLGYDTIDPASAVAVAHPDLAGVQFPHVVGSALFEQIRLRQGGLVALQMKPTDDLTMDFDYFTSKLEATNINHNYMVWNANIIGQGISPLPGYVVKNNTLISASFPNTGTTRGLYDQISRPGENASTDFYSFDTKYKANDRLTVRTKLGQSKGIGDTPAQGLFSSTIGGTGASYTLHGVGNPIDASLPGVTTSTPVNQTGIDWIYGASPAKTTDKEVWAQFDADYKLNQGFFSTLKFGARFAEHKRSTEAVGQGPNFAQQADPFDVKNFPAWGGGTYPSNFGSGLGGGSFPTNIWLYNPDQVSAWTATMANRDPVARRNWGAEFSLKERDSAAYVMSNLEGDGWSGNVGVRIVRTEEKVLANFAAPDATSVPGTIVGSAFGPFYQKEVANTYNDVLPSANLRFDLSKDLVARAAVSKTMTRPDYSSLGGAVALDDLTHKATGGNPNLKPIRSTNVDFSLEWYFAPKSLLSAGVYYMDLDNYVSFGQSKVSYYNVRFQKQDIYDLTSFVGTGAKVKGLELSYQQPIGAGFGVLANYTYADGKADKVAPTDTGEMVGTSKNTYNIAGYFENDKFNARLAWNYRSAFFNGIDRASAQHQDSVGTLSASLGYRINDNLSISLDALNLNEPKLKMYSANADQPLAIYNNGRQFYLMLRGKL